MSTTSRYLAGIALGAALLLPLAANAQVLENVRVRLPSGQVITINDGNDWYHDQRVVTYKRYYYDPHDRVYVVYNDDHDRYHHDDHRHGHGKGHFCPPGQAKKGRC